MTQTHMLTYAEALSEGLVQCMEQDPDVFVAGIGVEDHAGIFGTTLEAHKRFGSSRVFDTPASENALTGVAIGAAAMGKRPVVVHARNDFMFLALDQMVNLASKWAYMFGGNAGHMPIVVRGVIGRGWGQGATHSQSLQSIFGHFPGLQVVMPTTPADAKGLMISALTGQSPVVILEHRSLFNTVGPVPVQMIATPIGTGAVARSGDDVTVVATSAMVPESLRAAEGLVGVGIEVEVIDARSIRPLDTETIISSVRKTGRLVVADTSWSTYGFSAEVVATVAERAHSALKSPAKRIGLADSPAPVSKPLEDAFYPSAESVVSACFEVMGRSPAPVTIPTDPNPEFMGPY